MKIRLTFQEYPFFVNGCRPSPRSCKMGRKSQCLKNYTKSKATRTKDEDLEILF